MNYVFLLYLCLCLCKIKNVQTEKKVIDMKTIGQRLKKLRGDLSIVELSKRLGLKNSSIVSKWERGERNPKERALEAYAAYFDVPVDWIRYGDFDEYVKKVLYNAIKTDIPNKINDDLKKVLDKTPIGSQSLPEILALVNNPTEKHLKSLNKYIDRIISGLKSRNIEYNDDEIIINTTQILNNYISGVEGFSLIDMKLDEIYTIAKNMDLEIDHSRSIGEATFIDGVNAVIEFDGIFNVSDETKKEHQKLLKVIAESRQDIDRQIKKVKDSLNDKNINKLK